jgi:hypothetical protein
MGNSGYGKADGESVVITLIAHQLDVPFIIICSLAMVGLTSTMLPHFSASPLAIAAMHPIVGDGYCRTTKISTVHLGHSSICLSKVHFIIPVRFTGGFIFSVVFTFFSFCDIDKPIMWHDVIFIL